MNRAKEWVELAREVFQALGPQAELAEAMNRDDLHEILRLFGVLHAEALCEYHAFAARYPQYEALERRYRDWMDYDYDDYDLDYDPNPAPLTRSEKEQLNWYREEIRRRAGRVRAIARFTRRAHMVDEGVSRYGIPLRYVER